MAERLTKARKELFGPENEKALESSEILGLAYRIAGQRRKAEAPQMQVMEIRMTKPAERHPETLTNMANLASTYWNQGQWEESDMLFMQVMETHSQDQTRREPS